MVLLDADFNAHKVSYFNTDNFLIFFLLFNYKSISFDIIESFVFLNELVKWFVKLIPQSEFEEMVLTALHLHV